MFIIASMFLPVFVFAQQTDVAPTGTSQCANLTASFGYGMRDSGDVSNVAMLQDFLNSNGYLKVPTTGFFGKATLQAVKNFQSANGITPTGYVGAFTRAKIQDIDCNTSNSTGTNANVPLNNTSANNDRANTNPGSNNDRANTGQGENNDHGDQSHGGMNENHGPRANVMTQAQAQAFVSGLGITGPTAQTLINALTQPANTPPPAEGMHLANTPAEGMHLQDSIRLSQAATIDDIYVKAPNIMVDGKNLSYVKIYAVSSGTGVTAGTLLGNATLQYTGTSGDSNGEQKWSFTPAVGSYTQIYAEGYNLQSQLVGTVTLSLTGVSQIYNALWGTTANSASVSSNQSVTAPQLSTFTGSHGTFWAKSYGLSMVKIYAVGTGTGVVSGTLLGSMTLNGTSDSGAQSWSFPAPVMGMMATSVYAIGYTKDAQVNQVDFPYTGVSDINSHLY